MKVNTEVREKVENFSNPVLEARTKAGKTQAEFAELLGISRNYLWMLECGRKPITPKMLEKIKAATQDFPVEESLTPKSNQLDRIEGLLSEIRLLLSQLLTRIPPASRPRRPRK